jgi:hypothetical protein
MLMLDDTGQELWRHVWKPGVGSYTGGSLNNGHYYSDDKIVLLGFRYSASGPGQFVMETDVNGDIHWIRDFTLGTNIWGDPVIVINSVPMKVASTGNIFIVANEYSETFIVKLDEEGDILVKSKFSDDNTDRSVYLTDFVILEDESLLLTGYGYSFDTAFNVTVFGIIVRLDADFDFVEEKIILDQSYYLELNAAVLRDSIVFLSGAIQLDSVSSDDAFIVRYDLADEKATVVRIADFGARDYAYDVAIGADGRVFAGVQTQTVDNFYNLQMGYFWAADTVTAAHPVVVTPAHLQVFPNPARDMINILGPEHIRKVQAYAMNGSMMKLIPEKDNGYSVRGFPPGMYWLVVYTADDTRHIGRFIKID